jgi:predicted transposase YdaD
MSGSLIDESLTFRFDVVRVWRIPPESLLRGPISLLPLAAISQVTELTMPDIIRQMRVRIDSETSSYAAKTIWAATLILLGLNYKPDFARALLAGVMDMKESSTYQSILAEGRAEGRAEGMALGEELGKAEGERQLLIVVGSKRFGAPDAQTKLILDGITSARRLEELASRLLDVESWRELLNA